MQRRALLTRLLGAALALGACSSPTVPTDSSSDAALPEASPLDATEDSSADSSADARSDTIADSAMADTATADAAADATMDATTTEASADAAPEASAEAAVDAAVAVEAAAESGADASFDVVPVSPAWVRTFGAANDELVASVGVDRAGNVFVLTSFSGSLDLGGGTVTSHGANDVALVSYTPTGSLRWARAYGNAMPEVPFDLAVDDAGNVFFTLQTVGPLDLGTGPLGSRTGDMLLASVDNAGTLRWARHLGVIGSAGGPHLAVAPGGELLLGTSYSLATPLGTSLPPGDTSDLLVARLRNTGEVLAARAFHGLSFDAVLDVAADSAGNAHVAAMFTSTIDTGLGPHASVDGADVLLFSLDRALATTRYSVAVGGLGIDVPRAIAVDDADNVYVAGEFQSSLPFASGRVTSAGNYDVWVARASNAGVVQWARSFGGPTDQFTTGIAVDRRGNVVLGGRTSGAFSAGSGALVASGPADGLLLRLSASGALLDASTYGGPGTDHVLAVAVSPDNATLLGGSFSGSTTLQGSSFTSAGLLDGFVARSSF